MDLNNYSDEDLKKLMEKYKDDESYVPTAEEVEDIEAMVEDYYKSKEFNEYINNLDVDSVLAQHNAHEEGFDIDEINDSLKVKFTEGEVIEAVRALKNEDWFINGIRRELNHIWNRKNGYL